jgi:hypothetical protein
MYDPTKIPESTYKEIVELMGREKAEAFIEGEFYNYQAVSSKILKLRFKRFIRSKPILFAILVLVAIAMIFLWYYA